VETSAPDVDFGDFVGVGGVEESQLRMWSSHWKGPKRRPQNGSFWDFSPRCQFSCKLSAMAVETSTPDVDSGDFFGVGGVEGSQLRMWSSHWKGPKRRPQNGPFTD